MFHAVYLKLAVLGGCAAVSCAFVGICRLCVPENINSMNTAAQCRRRIGAGLTAMLSCYTLVYVAAFCVDIPNLRIAPRFTLDAPPYCSLLAAATAVNLLYLGHLVGENHLSADGETPLAFLVAYFKDNGDVCDPMVLKNIYVAPVFEELVYRHLLMPALLAAFNVSAVLINPLFFSLSHVHHAIDLVRARRLPVHRVLAATALQVGYTYLYGLFSAFLYYRHGSVLICAITHVFANLHGLPNIPEHLSAVSKGANAASLLITVSYLTGLGLFALLISL